MKQQIQPQPPGLNPVRALLRPLTQLGLWLWRGLRRRVRLAPRRLCARAMAAWFVALAFWAGFPPSRVIAQSQVYPEYQVKAPMLLSFSRFFKWPEEAPANAAAPFVVGADPDRVFADKVRGRHE